MQNNNNGKSTTKTSTNLNNKYTRGEVIARFEAVQKKHYLYGFVSFLMSWIFYVNFISPDWMPNILNGTEWGSIGQAVLYAIVGTLFTISITIAIMHSHTSDSPYVRYVMFVIVLGAGFNIFTETASTMDRVEERVTSKSTKSETYKALNDRIRSGSSTNNSALSKAQADYADALSTKNARCKKSDKANYSKRLCRKWTMRTEEYSIAMGLYQENTKTDLSHTVDAAKEAAHDESYAQAVVKLLMSMGLSYAIASMIISATIILVYEALGFLIGRDYRLYRDLLIQYGINQHRDKEIKADQKALKMEVEAEAQQIEDETRQAQIRFSAERKRLDMETKRMEQEIVMIKERAKISALKAKVNSELRIIRKKHGVFSTPEEEIKKTFIKPSNDEVKPKKVNSMPVIIERLIERGNDNPPLKTAAVKENSKEILPPKFSQTQIKRMVELKHIAKNTKNGEQILCPVCEVQFKKERNKLYCTNWKNVRPDGGNCADDYKNGIKPDRKSSVSQLRKKESMAKT